VKSKRCEEALRAVLRWRGRSNIPTRLLIHADAFNLGQLLRHLVGIGTPKALQGRSGSVLRLLLSVYRVLRPVLLVYAPSRGFTTGC
jgi:hypothetical protein